MRSIHRLTIVSVVCVALLVTSQPTHAYYDDIHYGLTYFIARLVGFTQEQAVRAASAAVMVDVDPETEPVMGGEWYLGSFYIPETPLTPKINIGYGARGTSSVLKAPIAHVPRWRFHAFRNELAVANVVGSEPGAAAADDLIRQQREALWADAKRLGNLGIFLHFQQDEAPHAKYGTGGGHWPVLSQADIERAERNQLPIGGSTDWLSFRSDAENHLLVEQTADSLKDFMAIVSPTQKPRDLDRAAVAFLVQALRAVNPAPTPLSGASIDVLKDAETFETLTVMSKAAAVGHFGNRVGLGPDEINNILRQRAGPVYEAALEKIDEALERAGIRSDADMPFEKIPPKAQVYNYDGLGALLSPRDPFVLSGTLTVNVVDNNPRRTLNVPAVPGQLGPTIGSDSSQIPQGGVAPPRQVKVVVRMAKSRVSDDEYVLGEATMLPGGQPVVFEKMPVGEILLEVVSDSDAVLSPRTTSFLLREQSSTTITIDSTASAIEACMSSIAQAKALAEKGDTAGAQAIYDRVLRQCAGLSASVDQSIQEVQRLIARARTDAATMQRCNSQITDATARAQQGDPAAAQAIYTQVVQACGGFTSLDQSIRTLRGLIDTELAGMLNRVELAWQTCSLEAALSIVDELQRAFPNHPTLSAWTSSNLARLRQDRRRQVEVAPIIREGETAMRANDLDTAIAKLRQARTNAPACAQRQIDTLLADLEQRQRVLTSAREAVAAGRTAAQRAQTRATQLRDRRNDVSVNGSQSTRQLEQAEALNRTADAALNRSDSGMSGFATGGSCAEASSLQAKLNAARSDTTGKLAELTSLIGQARRDASSCQSPAGAADIQNKLKQASDLQDQMYRTLDAATQMKTRLSQLLPTLTRDASADTRLAGSRDGLSQARTAIETAVTAGSGSSDLAKRAATGWSDLEQAVRDLLAQIDQTERNLDAMSWPDWVADLIRDSRLGAKKEFETARAMAKSVLEPPLAQFSSTDFLSRVAAAVQQTETLRLRYNDLRQRFGALDCNVDVSGTDPLNDIRSSVDQGKTEIARSLDLTNLATACAASTTNATSSSGTGTGTTAAGSGSGQRNPPTATQPRRPLPPEIPPGGGGNPLPGVTGGVQFTPGPPPVLGATLDCGPILELVPAQPKNCRVTVRGWRSDTTTPVEVLIDPLVGGVQASPGDTSQAGDTMYAAGVTDRFAQYVFSEGFFAARGATPSSQSIMITIRQRGHGLVQLPLTLNVIPVGAPPGITISPPAPNVGGSGGPFCVWQYKLTGDRPECWNFVAAACTSTRYAGRPEYVQVGNNMTWGQADARIEQLSGYFNDQYGCRATITRPPTPPAPPAVVTQGNGGIYSVWRYKLIGDLPQCFHFVAAPNGKFGPPSYELVGANMRQSEADARIQELSRYFDDAMGCRAGPTTQPPPPPPPQTAVPPQAPVVPPPAPVDPLAPPVPMGPAVRGLARFGILPASITVNIGDLVQLRALGVYTDAPNNVVDLSSNVRWGGEKPQSFTTSAADAGRTFTVTATALDGSTTSATVTVTRTTNPNGPQATPPTPTTTTSNTAPGSNVPSLFGGSTTRTDPGTIAAGGRGTPLNPPPPPPPPPTTGSGGTGTGTGGGNAVGGAAGGGNNSSTTSSGGAKPVVPCDDYDRKVFADMVGKWQQRMGPEVVIGGSCEAVTGTFATTDYCENPNATYNASLKRHRYTFTGRANSFVWQRITPLPDPKAKMTGTASCNGGGSLSCSGFDCSVSFAPKQ